MTVYVDADTAVINRALQAFGTRTTVTTAEMNALGSNEAIQSNLIYTKYRDQLLRMAPWNCGVKYANLIYLTSTPGTPENTSPVTFNWQPGQPAPPYAYEYMYPEDCLRDCWIVPNQNTGFASGIPITTAVTGGAASSWLGQPVKFKVSLDQFRAASGLVIVAGGSGFQVGDTAILGTNTLNNQFNANAVPAGIIKITVNTIGAGGSIATATLTNWSGIQVAQNAMLFGVPTYTLVQVQTSGLGSGASATVSGVGQTQFSARTILTNQEYAMMAYVQQVTDTQVFDSLFEEAYVHVLAAGVVFALTGDKDLARGLANTHVGLANRKIEEARKVDGNEGLTVNDVTPDWIRTRGIAFGDAYSGPWSGFDWGNLWATW